ncbi:hypothetical protein LTR56_000143 [Elasticomyces elasticus]|nr:hypothetical protein LTR56_000143 [Elasticomyces elasticus]KAK3667131.1 hypothetical protein LTR22_001995 [Elasticomyces elasticus]KAK4932906.1 hypothetical protein LTR49_000862 [Elasticomyces elasticus]KAK5768690.1 hypothetical protein LTS12_001116 [Elasticomyces elasticus]
MATYVNTDNNGSRTRSLEREHLNGLLYQVERLQHPVEQMETGLQSLRLLLETDRHLPSSVTQPILALLEDASATTRQVATACGKHREEVWRPNGPSAKVAQQVFLIPELCEHIFSHLWRHQDLHSVARVNRTIAAVLRGSLRLQQALGLAPQDQDYWYSPFERGMFDTFYCQSLNPRENKNENNEVIPGWRACVDAEFNFSRWDVSKSNDAMAAYRTTQICTPPLYEMFPSVSCCKGKSVPVPGDNDRLMMPRAIKPIKNATGLTVGDLYDAAVRLEEKHRLCPYASEWQLDMAGFVRGHVDFWASIELRSDDPIVTAYCETRAQSPQAWVPDESMKIDKMRRAYGQAKIEALWNRQPIPTLAEYLAAQPAKLADIGLDFMEQGGELLWGAITTD